MAPVAVMAWTSLKPEPGRLRRFCGPWATGCRESPGPGPDPRGGRCGGGLESALAGDGEGGLVDGRARGSQ